MSVIPAASSLILKALNEPERDRKKVRAAHVFLRTHLPACLPYAGVYRFVSFDVSVPSSRKCGGYGDCAPSSELECLQSVIYLQGDA